MNAKISCCLWSQLLRRLGAFLLWTISFSRSSPLYCNAQTSYRHHVVACRFLKSSSKLLLGSVLHGRSLHSSWPHWMTGHGQIRTTPLTRSSRAAGFNSLWIRCTPLTGLQKSWVQLCSFQLFKEAMCLRGCACCRDGRPSWRTSDNILLSKLTSVLDRLQRCQCQMLADCLLLLLKLARHFILPPATRSSESVRKARSPTAGASGDCHDEQTQQDSQACSEQQRAVSSAAQARQQHFIGKGLEAFACDLPCLIISSWRQASAQQLTGSKMVHAFLTRCYAYFSEISFKAETAILSQLEPHQRHAIFGADAPAKEWANPMQVCLWTLQDAAASNAKWAAQNSVDLEAEPEEKEARALWQADEVALGRHLLVHAEMVLSSNEARPSDPATLLSRAAHSVPFLLNTAGQRMVRLYPPLSRPALCV